MTVNILPTKESKKTPRWLTRKYKEYYRKYSREYYKRPYVRAKVREQARKRRLNPEYRKKWQEYHQNYVKKDRYMHGARNVMTRCRGNEMEYDADYLFGLAAEKPTHCPCCGIKFDLSYQKEKGRPPINGISYDRIDCTKGYVLGNVSIICWRCNTIKRDATLDELETIVRYMRQRLCL